MKPGVRSELAHLIATHEREVDRLRGQVMRSLRELLKQQDEFEGIEIAFERITLLPKAED